MKVKSLIVVAAIVAAVGMAIGTAYSSQKPLYYKCENVSDTDEYTIEINLNTHKAAFFDNDSWAVIPLKKVTSLESYPPQFVYNFQGKPEYDRNIMKIYFNDTQLSAGVIINVGTKDEATLEAKKPCRAVRVGDLFSGI